MFLHPPPAHAGVPATVDIYHPPPPGDIETSVAINPQAVEKGEDGRAKVACTAEVTIHLTPKVDNNLANRAMSVLNIPSLSEKLTAVHKEAAHPSSLGGSSGATYVGFYTTFVSTERAAMFIASNMEPYLPPVNDRLQASAISRGPQFKFQATPEMLAVFAALAGVVLAVYAIGARAKHLRASRGGGDFELVSQVKMDGGPMQTAAPPSPPPPTGFGGRRASGENHVLHNVEGKGVVGAAVEEGGTLNCSQRKHAWLARDGT